MGEVYCATDSTLGQEVAIKVLPEVFSRDSERLARFKREARLMPLRDRQSASSNRGLWYRVGLNRGET